MEPTGAAKGRAAVFEAAAGLVEWLSQKCLQRSRGLKRLAELWSRDEGQDSAEYAMMAAVLLVILIGVMQQIGSNANTVFSQVASEIQ